MKRLSTISAWFNQKKPKIENKKEAVEVIVLSDDDIPATASGSSSIEPIVDLSSQEEEMKEIEPEESIKMPPWYLSNFFLVMDTVLEVIMSLFLIKMQGTSSFVSFRRDRTLTKL
jgi:hypothetical protein